MLGGLEAYNSDDSDSETTQQPLAKPPPASTKPPFSFPPPKSKGRRTVFTIAKPEKGLSDDDDDDNQKRPAKKPRLDSRAGAGSSSLVMMLPAPKRAIPVPAAPARVLGGAAQGGGGVGVIMASASGYPQQDDDPTAADFESKSTILLPPSLSRSTKGKAAATAAVATPTADSTEKPEPSPKTLSVPSVDFFSLASSTPKNTTTSASSSLTPPPSSSFAISSAPIIPTFEPPSPSPADPYPGYYQLPSGEWAAHDPEVYRKHYEQWMSSMGLDGRTEKGFEGAEGNETVNVDAQAQLDLARKEREERKALTMKIDSGPKAPKMNIKAAKAGSVARTRHQLSTLLTEAYENREALEEKIAQGKRNRKEAGNKYGF
ncbi:mitotic checkpoint regulator, MAD2B-interacting-domain-containing protein [Hysterangium stoloniferum]|nr:mitotic checkpoint regulator, MAD2B-interacting-domain-containing protein [Hysterangium stoloniferum]